MGASIRFAFVKWHYYPSPKFYKHIFWRSFSIFVAGLLLNSFPFIRQDWDFSTLRIMGVLQRIALAYGLSAILIIKYDFKQLIQILTAILIFYWGLLWFGSTGDPYSLSDNVIRRFDIFIFNPSHLYHGFHDSFNNKVAFDPESIFSTIPAIATVLIGYLMGGMIHTTKNYADCSKRMSLFGLALVSIGLLWSLILPINKALWTSSYVLFTGGISAIVLAGLTYIIDNKNIKKPFWIFEVFGTNSIFLFIISGLWVKTMLLVKLTLNGSQVSAYNYLYKTLFVPILGNLNGSLFFAIFHVIGFWVILFWMQKKNIKIKL